MSQTQVTISDRGTALIALDLESERLSAEIKRWQEEQRLAEQRIERNRVKLRAIYTAMKSIHQDGVYTLRDFV